MSQIVNASIIFWAHQLSGLTALMFCQIAPVLVFRGKLCRNVNIRVALEIPLMVKRGASL